MYSKYNIESKVNCNQYGALLSGATGALGLGGGGGGAGVGSSGYGGATATTGSYDLELTPTNTIDSGGFSFAPTISVTMPNSKVGNKNDINPPLELFSGGMSYLWLGLGAIVIVMFFLIFGRK